MASRREFATGDTSTASMGARSITGGVNFERRGVVRVRAAAPKLVELVVAPTPAVGPQAPFVVRVGGVELEVNERFDEGSLRRLVGVLKSC